MKKILLLTILMLLSGCSTQVAQNIPSDFYMMLDARDADHQTATNINLRIHANGTVDYDIYETGGVIHYDEVGVVRFEKGQVVRDGKFRFTSEQMGTLWKAISDQRFFELFDKYQMQIGYSYAFLLIEADREKHVVDNIGMEVPEMRTLVEIIASMMPNDINIEYGEGYVP